MFGKNKPLTAVLLIVLIVLLLEGGIEGHKFSTYRPGWELSTDLVGFEVNGQVTHTPSATSWTESGSPAPGAGGVGAVYRFESSSNLQWDFDDADYGMPDIKATSSDLREETPKIPYSPLQNDVAKFRYITEYHEYLFDVQIRTVAGVTGKVEASGWMEQTMVWTHETSMAFQWLTNAGPGGDKIGKPFDGGVYVRFVCKPWGIPDQSNAPANYTFKGYWLGVMNAKVEKAPSGVATPDIEITDKGWVRNIESVGSQLNMFEDDGTFGKAYTEIPWDTSKVLDPDIKSAVIVYLPINLMAGAWAKYDASYNWYNGAVVECKPVDYYVTYTVRMETLITKEYEFRDPGISPNPSPIQTPKDYVPYTALTFWDKYGFWIIVIAIIVVGLLVLGSFFTLPLLSNVLGVFRYCDVYGGEKQR